MIFKLIRWPLGKLILLLDFLTRPRPPQRTAGLQQQIDQATRGLALYQFHACPFCVKTRRAMRRLGLQIETRDAQGDPHWRQQLLTEGGKLQVPCLYLPQPDGGATWLYESDAIIAFLDDTVRRVEAAETTEQAA